ncbi:MAG: 30S ribosomal protein S21 [Lewinella sp.]|nr:30S ribosomal protein S21 [Lewinella sp.]
MLIIERRDGETIDRLLKRYKRKHRKVQVTKNLRQRQFFTKPSIKRRAEILNAEYREQKYQDNE